MSAISASGSTADPHTVATCRCSTRWRRNMARRVAYPATDPMACPLMINPIVSSDSRSTFTATIGSAAMVSCAPMRCGHRRNW